jgi:hypothetical protein
MSDERVILTPDQAIAMLDPEAERIHTFVQAGPCLLGADHDSQDLLDEINSALQLEIGGEMCCRMNHGLVVWRGKTDPLFVECRDGLDYEDVERCIRTESLDERQHGN